jgi:DNA-binding transcriptional regulator YiaG
MTGTDLRQRRQRLGLRRKAFAKLLDVHWKTVTKWELGERKISPMAAQLIERVCAEETQTLTQRSPPVGGTIRLGNGPVQPVE